MSSALTSSCFSMVTDATDIDYHVLGAGDLPHDLLALLSRRQSVGGPDDHEELHRLEDRQGAALVVLLQGRKETRPPRRSGSRRDHPGDEAPGLVGGHGPERVQAGQQQAQVAVAPPAPLDQRLASRHRGGDGRGEPLEDRAQHGRKPQPALVPPAVVAMSPTPYTRSANSSGRCSASAMIVIPPMECPMSRRGPVGATASMTDPRSRPSWSTWCESKSARPERPWLRWS